MATNQPLIAFTRTLICHCRFFRLRIISTGNHGWYPALSRRQQIRLFTAATSPFRFKVVFLGSKRTSKAPFTGRFYAKISRYQRVTQVRPIMHLALHYLPACARKRAAVPPRSSRCNGPSPRVLHDHGHRREARAFVCGFRGGS